MEVTAKHNEPPLSDRLAIDHETLTERVADLLTLARETIPAEITTDDENSKIGDVVKGIRKLLTEIANAKDTEKRPHLDANKIIEDFFKTLTERLTKGRDVIEARGKKFLDKKAADERQRREDAAQAAREEAERKLQEAQVAEDQGKDVHAEIKLEQATQADRRAQIIEKAVDESAADMARTRLAGGGVSTLRTTWNFTVEDHANVDLNALRSFFSNSDIEKAIRGFVRSGGRQLRGVKIYEDTAASYR
ncbi:hypothetical protein I6H96_02740 [Brucella anthropi]|uniref:Uncharacterized protein n=1 Tax=Brucella anthropi (strain ATCC 49188 / DSM 6882 / CCUG 24695 / JCM 21032 / LMG 3331 / NBRC 15819 / NCTC 12168 / Alc 37) TaxID=439375 RepID=A6WZ63_BRUA4|nr:hypothetical protein [Brucella anthropi]ABS14267.1 hypothetical protein Oant_1551 [Brucella anthropi ATCC 49188]QQC25798.1 hypothetical protein I6H96_02740 [Brucella anthropi]SUA65387.1 Uncharacterised protein [Brucella anthropi]